MKLKIVLPPRSIEGKLKSFYELKQYFGVSSADELLLALRALRREGLFDFEVLISKEYLKWEDAHLTLQLRADVLKPVNQFGMLQIISKYKMALLYPKIKAKQALTESEINDSLQKLPPDMVGKYFQFKITSIDWVNLGIYATSNMLKTRQKKTFSCLPPTEYKGLKYEDSQIFYLGEVIPMRKQFKNVLRVLIDKEGSTCWPSDFYNTRAEIFPHSNYDDDDGNLRKYISGAHNKLRAVVKNKEFIKNVSEAGWKLII
jgi:hypothetical protein